MFKHAIGVSRTEHRAIKCQVASIHALNSAVNIRAASAPFHRTRIHIDCVIDRFKQQTREVAIATTEFEYWPLKANGVLQLTKHLELKRPPEGLSRHLIYGERLAQFIHHAVPPRYIADHRLRHAS